MATRITAFILAGLFLISTIGFSIYVLFAPEPDRQPEPVTSEEYQPSAQDLAEAQGLVDSLQQQQEEVSLLEDFTPIQERVAQLEIIDLVLGEGAEVAPGATVTVHYTGALVSDGSIFDTSHPGDPVTFGLDGLIEGWQLGIPGMKVGGKRRLIVPAAQAYGNQSTGSIPIDSDLVFEIELIGISN